MATASSSGKAVRNSFSPNLFQLRTLEENSRTAKRMKKGGTHGSKTAQIGQWVLLLLGCALIGMGCANPESAAVETEEPSGSEWERTGGIPDTADPAEPNEERRVPGPDGGITIRFGDEEEPDATEAPSEDTNLLGGEDIDGEMSSSDADTPIEEEGDSTAPEADGETPEEPEGDVENGTDGMGMDTQDASGGDPLQGRGYERPGTG